LRTSAVFRSAALLDCFSVLPQSHRWALLICNVSIVGTDPHNCRHVQICLLCSPKQPVMTCECSRSMTCMIKHVQGQLAQHHPREHGHNLLVCSRGSQLMTYQMYKSPQTRLGVLPWQEPVPHASLSCVKRYPLQRNCSVTAASATQTACMLVSWSLSPLCLPALHDTWDQFAAPLCNQQQLL